MPTRRSTHANHTRRNTAAQRRASRYSPRQSGQLHASRNGRGGHAAPRDGKGIGDRALNGSETLITRRHFLYGALGVGALAVAVGGASAIAQQTQSSKEEVTVLQVPEESVLSSDDSAAFSLIENAEERLSLVGDFELPYGTLVWSSDEAIAACLIPNEASAKPLAQVGLLSLSSGNCPIVLEQAVGQDDGFEIYDVRAVEGGVIWTEADILDGVWRIYTARADGASLGTPVLMDEGNEDWETPTIAATQSHAFWQVLPRSDGAKRSEESLLKRASFGSGASETVYSSRGRMATPPYALATSVVITPRADTSSVNYQLTLLEAKSASVLDSLVLPQSMKPLEAGYGTTGFMFSFDAVYNYGGGIANLGTYTPASPVTDGNYSGAPWFRFARTPSAPPAWCGRFLMVKSTGSVCAIDLDASNYAALDVPDGSDTYGDYLASTGTGDMAVTFTNVDHQPLGGEAVKCCRVRVWTPAA